MGVIEHIGRLIRIELWVHLRQQEPAWSAVFSGWGCRLPGEERSFDIFV